MMKMHKNDHFCTNLMALKMYYILPFFKIAGRNLQSIFQNTVLGQATPIFRCWSPGPLLSRNMQGHWTNLNTNVVVDLNNAPSQGPTLWLVDRGQHRVCCCPEFYNISC